METIKIAHLSDIHFSRIFPRKLFYLIYQNLVNIKPDYICITGDMIDQASLIEKETYRNELQYWLKKYGEIAPVIIGLGNHDMMQIKKGKTLECYHKEWFLTLNTIPNVHFLDNQEYIPNRKISFYGATIPFEHYQENEKNELQLSSGNWKGEGYRVMLLHSPQHCVEEQTQRQNPMLANSDLVLAGHMHRGIVPRIITKLINSNRGFVSPQKTFFPNYARGIVHKIVNQKKITLVISGGVVKFSETAPKLFHKLNGLFASEMTVVEIDEKKFVKAKDLIIR